MDIRACRFCRAHRAGLIKYGVRQYAHTKCLIAAKGEEFVERLPLAQLGRLEAFALSDRVREAIMVKLEKARREGALPVLPL